MTKTVLAISLAFGSLLTLASRDTPAQEDPTPTRIVIRVVSHDAKIIGSGVGGALVRVVNAETGDVLAEGRQEGETGDTELIMTTPRTRGMPVYDTEAAAAFVAELQLSEPTIVNISALGPLAHPQAIQTATKRMLVVPGGHIEGDGVILELHGFIVEIELPEPLAPIEGAIEVQARVRMMCGCPLSPGGMWNSDEVEIVARLLADGKAVAATELAFSGEESVFVATLEPPPDLQARDVELEVTAADPARLNFGRHAIPLGSF